VLGWICAWSWIWEEQSCYQDTCETVLRRPQGTYNSIYTYHDDLLLIPIITAVCSSCHVFPAHFVEPNRLARETYMRTLLCENLLHHFRETSSLYVYDSRT
jgi:hypothetical protein